MVSDGTGFVQETNPASKHKKRLDAGTAENGPESAPFTCHSSHKPTDFTWTPEKYAQYRCDEVLKSTITLYRTDAILERSFSGAGKNLENCERGVIGASPSRKSLQNLTFLLNNSDIPFGSMWTFTMTDKCHRDHSVKQHKKVLWALIQGLRRLGISQYVWVREFQENGSVHWHIFVAYDVGRPGEINHELSSHWSKWFASQYRKMNGSAECVRKMSFGNGFTFHGCTQVEQLRTEAGGRYAAKEGAKRFQKQAPKKWAKAGRWWGASRGIECSPIKTIQVDPDSLEGCEIEIDGQMRSVAFKLQHSRGLKERNSDEQQGRKAG